jgi:hypothetical protein
MEKIPSATDEEQPRAKKSLDDLIGEGLDKHEAALADKESFTKSKASRDELNERYGAQGDLSTTIDQYIQWGRTSVRIRKRRVNASRSPISRRHLTR